VRGLAAQEKAAGAWRPGAREIHGDGIDLADVNP
jgi:hypothetical protein